MTQRALFLVVGAAFLSACQSGTPEQRCLAASGCAPEYADGGYSPAGCRLEESYLEASWPNGTGTVPRNLHLWSMRPGDVLKEIPGTPLRAQFKNYDGQYEVHGNYYILVRELTPLEDEAPHQTPVAAVLAAGMTVELVSVGRVTGSFVTSSDVDVTPPPPPSVELVEVQGPRRNCVSGGIFQVTREPETLVMVRHYNPGNSGMGYDIVALTDGQRVVTASKQGGTESLEFIAIDKAGNRSTPTRVTYTMPVRIPTVSADRLRIAGARRASFRTGTRLDVEAGVHTTHLSPIEALAVEVKEGSCSVVAQRTSDGRFEAEVTSSTPGKCLLRFIAQVNGVETSADDQVVLEDAAPLVFEPRAPDCPDGTSLRWQVGGATVCRAPGRAGTVVFPNAGQPVRVDGTVLAALDDQHLLVCTATECSARDASGTAKDSLPFGRFEFPSLALLANRHLSPHDSVPRALRGNARYFNDTKGSAGLNMLWDRSTSRLSWQEIPQSPSIPSAAIPWGTRWVVELPSPQRATAQVWDIESAALVLEVEARPADPPFLKPTVQVIGPYLKIEDRLYVSPLDQLAARLPVDVWVAAGAGCVLVGSSRNGERLGEGSLLWWMDVCDATTKVAVGKSTEQSFAAWVAQPDALWVQTQAGVWERYAAHL